MDTTMTILGISSLNTIYCSSDIQMYLGVMHFAKSYVKPSSVGYWGT